MDGEPTKPARFARSSFPTGALSRRAIPAELVAKREHANMAAADLYISLASSFGLQLSCLLCLTNKKPEPSVFNIFHGI